MAKKTGNASDIRNILKNKEAFQFDLRSRENDGTRITSVYDVFYENKAGTFTVATDNGKVVVAALNFNMGRITSLVNDANIRKLADYVLENTHE